MSNTQLFIRGVVRAIFWGTVIALSVLAMYAFYLAVWSLQFPY